MNRKQAEAWITCAWLLSAIGIVLGMAIRLHIPVVTQLLGHGIHLYLPWLFPGRLAFPLTVVLSILTMLLAARSRVAALLILCLYLLLKGFVLMWLHDFTPLAILLWLVVALACGLIFVQAVRATFAWQRL